MRLSRTISNDTRTLIRETIGGLPVIPGGPIFIDLRPNLTAHRGKLLSDDPHVGTAVHAASFIRGRRIVIERQLAAQPSQFRSILIHELFHFVWPRLSNALRTGFGELLRREINAGARGELGESASVRKVAFQKAASSWQDYVCESFCDTAAWFYSAGGDHADARLAQRWRRARSNWFEEAFERYWKLRYL